MPSTFSPVSFQCTKPSRVVMKRISFTCGSPFRIAWYRWAMDQRWGMLKLNSFVSFSAASPVMVLRQVRKGTSSSSLSLNTM